MERYLSLHHLQRYPMTFYDQQKVMKAPIRHAINHLLIQANPLYIM